jgi:hypothetical protein
VEWKVCRDEKPAEMFEGAGESEAVLLAWMEGDSSDLLETETWVVYRIGFYRVGEGWFLDSEDKPEIPVMPVFWAELTDPFENVRSWEVDYHRKK